MRVKNCSLESSSATFLAPIDQAARLCKMGPASAHTPVLHSSRSQHGAHVLDRLIGPTSAIRRYRNAANEGQGLAIALTAFAGLSRLPLLCTMLMGATPVSAALMVYTDYASWSAAAGVAVEAITFDTATGGPFSAGHSEGGVLFQGISAGAYNGYLYATHAGYCATSGCLVGPATEPGALGATDGYLRATLAAAVMAVAVEVGTYHSAGDIPSWVFSNGDNYVGPADIGGANFIGFISSTPFGHVDHHISVGSSGGDFTVMDTFYAPVSVSEPGSMALLALSLAALGLSATSPGTRRVTGRPTLLAAK